MGKLIFNFTIPPSVVQSDREHLNIGSLDDKGLRRFGKGEISIAFPNRRELIVIQSEVLDYLMQLIDVIEEVDAGNHQTFAVSPDFYSNNLQFTYNPASKNLEIYEVNEGEFRFRTKYEEFKMALLGFFKDALSDLLGIYPELNDNKCFQKRQNKGVSDGLK